MLRLKGIITEDGKLEVNLPEGIPPGEVIITLEMDQPITEEELNELMAFKPATGAEIADMLEASDGWWEDVDIPDSVAWVEEQRKKQRCQW